MIDCAPLMVLRFLVSALLLTLAGTARADLDWQAPADCPQSDAVQAEVARALSRDVGQIAVEARVTRGDGTYRLDLRMETPGATTERTLFADHCAAFAELIALELGVASALGDAVPAARSFDWNASVRGGMGTGPGPGIAPRIGLRLGRRVRRVRVDLGASYDFAQQEHYRAQPAVGARFSMVAGQLRTCVTWSVGALELPLCVGAELGALIGEGRGQDSTRRATRVFAGGSAAMGVRYPREGRFAAFAELEGLIGLLRPSFGFRNLPPLYRPPLFTIRGALGVEVQFE